MSSVLFRDASVLDGTGAAPFSADVLIEGNRIARLSPPGQLPPLPGVDTVDCNGATLMPGLVEPHAHLSFVDQSTLRRNLRRRVIPPCRR
jgi:imidazolonepropionase-like amidohydrolase